MKMSTGSIY